MYTDIILTQSLLSGLPSSLNSVVDNVIKDSRSDQKHNSTPYYVITERAPGGVK